MEMLCKVKSTAMIVKSSTWIDKSMALIDKTTPMTYLFSQTHKICTDILIIIKTWAQSSNSIQRMSHKRLVLKEINIFVNFLVIWIIVFTFVPKFSQGTRQLKTMQKWK